MTADSNITITSYNTRANAGREDCIGGSDWVESEIGTLNTKRDVIRLERKEESEDGGDLGKSHGFAPVEAVKGMARYRTSTWFG